MELAAQEPRARIADSVPAVSLVKCRFRSSAGMWRCRRERTVKPSAPFAHLSHNEHYLVGWGEAPLELAVLRQHVYDILQADLKTFGIKLPADSSRPQLRIVSVDLQDPPLDLRVHLRVFWRLEIQRLGSRANGLPDL